MQIIKINSADSNDWYQAQETLLNGAICTGFGSTEALAVADCSRQVEHTKKLQRSLNITTKHKTKSHESKI